MDDENKNKDSMRFDDDSAVAAGSFSLLKEVERKLVKKSKNWHGLTYCCHCYDSAVDSFPRPS